MAAQDPTISLDADDCVEVDIRGHITLPDGGDRISDKYIITRKLGEGGMGVVYEAVHLRLRQPVALKFLHPESLSDPEACARFEREARATGRLRGQHVAHVLDVDVTAEGLPYIVMELLEGSDLEKEREKLGGPFPVTAAVDYILQACVAMAEAHGAGIVHRDLKPSNLFLVRSPGKPDAEPLVKVLDFGISKILDGKLASVTNTCVSIGTPLYMSPEQIRSAKHVDGRSDIWALGVILYELLAGEPPFAGTATAAIAAIVADEVPPLREKNPAVPVELEHIVLRALEKDCNARWQDVGELAEALAPFASIEVELPEFVRRRSFCDLPETEPLVPLSHPTSPTSPTSQADLVTARASSRSRVRTGPRQHPRHQGAESDSIDTGVSLSVQRDALSQEPWSVSVFGPLAGRVSRVRPRTAFGVGLALLLLPALTLASWRGSAPAPRAAAGAIESPMRAPQEARRQPAPSATAVHIAAPPPAPSTKPRAPRNGDANPLYL